jgi:hypothetical protein
MRDGSGTKSDPRGTTIVEGDVADEAALKVGDTQYLQFTPECTQHPDFSQTYLVGTTKGLKQVLWERGLYEIGMKRRDGASVSQVH